MKKKIFTALVIVSALIYISLSVWLLFFGPGRVNVAAFEGMQMNRAYNLVPFRTILEYIMDFGSGHAKRNLIGNLLLLFPMGFYIPFFSSNAVKLLPYMLTVALLIVAIEVTQFITYSGSLDIDDFILNFMGAIIGYGVFACKPIRNIFKLRA